MSKSIIIACLFVASGAASSPGVRGAASRKLWGKAGAWESCDSRLSYCGSGLTCTSNRKCSPNAGPGEFCGDSAGGVDCAASAGGKNWCTESGDGWRCSSGEEGQLCSAYGAAGATCNTGLDCISKGYCAREAKDGEPCGGGSGITCEKGSDCRVDWRAQNLKHICFKRDQTDG